MDARLGNTFFDFVVKCKYRKEEGQVRAVFVPFAIVRSFTYEDVWQCFKQLLEGTSYYEEIVDYVKSEEMGLDEAVLMKMNHNHNFGRALVRAVIYVVSMYIGSSFRERVELITGRRITIDKEIMKEHTVPGFIRSVEEMWNSFDSNQYRLRLMMCSKTKKVSAINSEENDRKIREPGTDEIVGDYIQFRMISLNKSAKKVKDTILTMETIEEELDSRYYFEDDTQRKNIITKNILTLMEDSRMGNEIILDNESGVLYRGFRKGENSEVIFSRGFLWMYAYAFALFYTKGVNGYLDNIRKVMRKAELWFREEDYIPNLLTESEWRLYQNYFLQMEDPHEQILNKKGLLNSYRYGSMKAGEKALIEEAFMNVKDWLR